MLLDRTLLVYCKSAACFWYFDSLSSRSAVPAHARAIATKLTPLVSVGSSGTIEVAVRNTPRQANGYDCGVYVLAIAEWLCSNVAGATAAAADLDTIESLAPSAISAKRTAISAIIRSLAST
jgi:sentrin-specific protease 8